MSKIFALMTLFNVLMGGLYVVSNLAAWSAVNLWVVSDVASQWSMVFITPVLVGTIHSLPTNVQPQLNYPFWLFWVTMIGNMIFAIMIQRKKQATILQSPAANQA